MNKLRSSVIAGVVLVPVLAVSVTEQNDACNLSSRPDRFIENCLRLLSQSMGPNPTSAIAFYSQATVHHSKGNLDRARADYDNAISLDPEFAIAYYNRGTVHYSKGEFDRAWNDYDRAINLDPKIAHAYYSRGVIFRIKGDLDRARADFDHAISLDPALGPLTMSHETHISER